MYGFDYSPVIISLRTASVSIVVTFFAGLFAAQTVSGIKCRPLKIIVDAILTLPLVLPPTVAGFFLLAVFGARGPAGRFFLHFFSYSIAFSPGAAVLAAVVISFPLMYRSALGALEQVDPALAPAGRTLGMSETAIFFMVTLPAAAHGIVSGAILAFARALGEFGATAMIAGNIAGKTRTMPLAIYSAAAGGDMDIAGRYVLIIVLLSFIAVAFINYCAIMAHSASSSFQRGRF
jgi:molybdate transport system permease protein